MLDVLGAEWVDCPGFQGLVFRFVKPARLEGMISLVGAGDAHQTSIRAVSIKGHVSPEITKDETQTHGSRSYGMCDEHRLA